MEVTKKNLMRVSKYRLYSDIAYYEKIYEIILVVDKPWLNKIGLGVGKVDYNYKGDTNGKPLIYISGYYDTEFFEFDNLLVCIEAVRLHALGERFFVYREKDKNENNNN